MPDPKSLGFPSHQALHPSKESPMTRVCSKNDKTVFSTKPDITLTNENGYT